jgi:hypothetical protein
MRPEQKAGQQAGQPRLYNAAQQCPPWPSGIECDIARLVQVRRTCVQGITIINLFCSIKETNVLSGEYSTRNASGAVEGKFFALDRVGWREGERVI